MAATAAQIREKAARKLGVLGIMQTLSAEIAADLDAAYTEVYDELETRGVATWAFSSSVPSQYVNPVVSLVAMYRATDYGLPVERYQMVMAEGMQALNKMRALQARRPMGQTEIEYF